MTVATSEKSRRSTRRARADAIALLRADHASAKQLIQELEAMQPGDDHIDAKVTVLAEYIRHHVKEEQKEMFPKIRKTSIDLKDLGAKLRQRKTELMGGAEAGMTALKNFLTRLWLRAVRPSHSTDVDPKHYRAENVLRLESIAVPRVGRAHGGHGASRF